MHSDAQLGQYIPLHYHYQMLLDEARMRGFAQAIAYNVLEGARVLELGGGTGVLSCFAARQGARVWCVERQPELAETARRLLEDNGVGDRVEVVTADVGQYLPPEPVDFVICEMLHSALLREKQIQIIDDFKRRYLEVYESLPRFIPEATLLGVEPVQHDFDFFGYHATVPVFEDPANPFANTISLGDPTHYAIIDYSGQLPSELRISGQLPVNKDGFVNALRFITSNVLAVMPETGGTIQWMNQNLILPLPADLLVQSGSLLDLAFAYKPGDEIQALSAGIQVSAPEIPADAARPTQAPSAGFSVAGS